MPGNEQFRLHFETLLKSSTAHNIEEIVDIDSAPSIPVLDDPCELSTVMSNMEKNKS